MHVVDLPVTNQLDIVKTLREIADSIEDNTYGNVIEGVLVLRNNGLEVFKLGESDGATTHLLLSAAAIKLCNGVLFR